MPHAAQLKNWIKDGTNSRIAQFGKPNGFAYIHTGLNEWSVNGTTLAISKKGSGLAGVLNPCIEKVPPFPPPPPGVVDRGDAHAHAVPARQLDVTHSVLLPAAPCTDRRHARVASRCARSTGATLPPRSASAAPIPHPTVRRPDDAPEDRGEDVRRRLLPVPVVVA